MSWNISRAPATLAGIYAVRSVECCAGLVFVIEPPAAPMLVSFTDRVGEILAGVELGVAGGEVGQIFDGLTSVDGVVDQLGGRTGHVSSMVTTATDGKPAK